MSCSLKAEGQQLILERKYCRAFKLTYPQGNKIDLSMGHTSAGQFVYLFVFKLWEALHNPFHIGTRSLPWK